MRGARGRFGGAIRGGLENLFEGGIGGGNVLRGIAEGLFEGGGGGGGGGIGAPRGIMDRAGPDFSGSLGGELEDDWARWNEMDNMFDSQEEEIIFGESNSNLNVENNEVYNPVKRECDANVDVPSRPCKKTKIDPMVPDAPTSSSTPCGCKSKPSCEEKCQKQAYMAEKCKGCRAYYRKKKAWIYPKNKNGTVRKYCYSRKQYRRRKS